MWHTYSVTFPLRNLSPSATPSRLPCLRHLHLFFIHSVRQFAETNISERSLNLLINYVKISVCPFGPNCMGQVLPGQQFSDHFDRRPPHIGISQLSMALHTQLLLLLPLPLLLLTCQRLPRRPAKLSIFAPPSRTQREISAAKTSSRR